MSKLKDPNMCPVNTCQECGFECAWETQTCGTCKREFYTDNFLRQKTNPVIITKTREQTRQSILDMLKSIPHHNKSVVVYDIDRTLVNDDHTPIPEIIDTYRRVIELGFRTVIITARANFPIITQTTVEELEHIGVKHYSELYLMPPGDSPEKYKTNLRKSIENQGYEIVMSVGDMMFDIQPSGGFGFLVPPS